MRQLLLSFLLATSTFSFAQITETATEAVKNMGVGWNLGNTLDANKSNAKDPSNNSYWYNQGLGSENYWGQPNTKKELMKMMKEAGFGAIRVPVTWYNHMDKSGKVDATWMKRVHEIVDYVIDNGMYCIINVHHDTGADNDSHISWIKADEQNYNNNKERYEYLWKQIAEEFKDYDKHLLFEGYNEMLDTKSSWCYASFNTTSKYDATISNSAYKGINGYAQSFVNAVRATGGNNESRNLIVNTYAAANGYGTWSSHLKEVLTKMNIPEDKVSGHIAVEVHDYPNITTNGTNRKITDIKSQVDGTIKVLKDNIISKGIPVIIGEWGTSNVGTGAGKTDYDVRRDLMFQFVDYYVKQAKANDIATFYWMGLTDGFYREGPSFHQADLAERITKAYHGEDFKGIYPEPKNESSFTCFDGDKMLDWGNAITIPAEIFKSVGDKAQLELTYKLEITDYDDILLCKGGDWSKINFKVDDKSFTGDLNPKSYYKTTNGKALTTVFTFDNTTYNTLSQSGLIIQGHGIRLYKAVLFDPTATGIEPAASIDVTFHDKTMSITSINGAVLSVSNYSSIVEGNSSEAIDLSNAILSNDFTEEIIKKANANLYYLPQGTSISGKNIVVGNTCPELVLTDGNSFSTPKSFTATNATYERSISGTWGTIMLPYEVKSNDDVEYYIPTAVENNMLVIEKKETLPANTPALVAKINGSKIQANAQNVTINAMAGTSANGSVTMHGSYESNTKITDSNAYYIKDDKFVRCNGYFFVDAFRAYFTVSGTDAKTIGIPGIGEATAIDALLKDDNTKGVSCYDESGKQINSLKSGVNIIRLSNGQTIKVKR